MFMKYFILILGFIFFGADTFTGKVIGVKDGDTLVLLKNDQTTITVRLAKIDAPEKSQPFGDSAKRYTSGLCYNQEVKVVSVGSDKYGRTLGIVYLSDGRCLNQILVSAGLAWHFIWFSDDKRYDELEKSARDAKKGLWSIEVPEEPWEFRKSH